jgi:hypothetical protein
MTGPALSCLGRAGVLTWLALLIVGCTEVTDEPPSVPLSLTVLTDFGESRVEGVDVCGADPTKCVTTNPNGQATLELPPDEEITWTLTKKGFASTLIADVTDATLVSTTSVILARDAWVSDACDSLMTPCPVTDTGVVLIWTDPPVKGATFDLVDAEGTGFYSDDDANPSLEFDATTTSGIGGFVEVDPGVVQVEIGGNVEGCVIGWGWPGDGPNTIRLRVREGYTTYASADCD